MAGHEEILFALFPASFPANEIAEYTIRVVWSHEIVILAFVPRARVGRIGNYSRSVSFRCPHKL